MEKQITWERVKADLGRLVDLQRQTAKAVEDMAAGAERLGVDPRKFDATESHLIAAELAKEVAAFVRDVEGAGLHK